MGRARTWIGKAGPALYAAWGACAIGIAFAADGPSARNATRVGVLLFLGLQLAFRKRLASLFPRLSPRARFVLLGCLLAAVVEGFHMVSEPLWPWLRVGRGTPPLRALGFFLIDVAATTPAYVAILSVIWALVSRFQFTPWGYALTFALAQTLGDGGLFLFSGNPGLLFFLPYPMTNYHAMNVIPYLAVAESLDPTRPRNLRALLAVPAVVATYLVCGGMLKALGAVAGPS